MKKCSYTQSIRDVSLEQSDKNVILQNLYDIQQQKLAQKAKKKKIWISVTATCTLAVFVVLFFVLAFGVQVFHFYIVNNPIDLKMREYITTTSENAQYLPNIYLMAGVQDSGNVALKEENQSNQDIVFAEDNQDSQDSVTDMTTAQCDIEYLSLDLEDYRYLNDKLGNISTASQYVMTVDDLKEEVMAVMQIIPGYDQWFRFPNELPHMYYYESLNYTSNKYYISVDEENTHITLKKVSSYITSDAYDIEKDKYYVYGLGLINPCYKREISQIDFYINEEGKEVVECTFNKFICVGRNYYPINTQILKNIKDTSTTKIEIVYSVQHDLIEPYEYTINGNIDQKVDEVYVLQDYSKYGTYISFSQLDYTDKDNIQILDIVRFIPNEYNSNDMSGRFVMYNKSGDKAFVYSDVWFDYIYPQEYGKFSHINTSEASLKNNFVRELMLRNNIYPDVCNKCEESNCADSYKIKYCPHYLTSDSIKSNSKLFVTSYGEEQTEEYARQVIGSQLEKLYSNTLLSEKGFEVDESRGLFAFEETMEDYLEEVVKQYVDNYYDFDAIIKEFKYAERHYAKMSPEDVNNTMIDQVLYLSNIDAYNTFSDKTIHYDMEITVSNGEYDEDKQYYLALYLEPISSQKDLLDIVEVDLEESKVYHLQGDITIQQLLDTSCWVAYTSYSKDLVVALISYDENGEVIEETPYRELNFTPAYIQLYYEENTCKKDLKSMFYRIDLGTNLSFYYRVY